MDRKKAAIFALSLLTIMSTDTVAPLVKQISTSFPNIDLALIKQTITLPSLMMIFFGLIAGQLVRVIPRRRAVIGLALYSVGEWQELSQISVTPDLRACWEQVRVDTPVITSLSQITTRQRARDLVGIACNIPFYAVVTPPLQRILCQNCDGFGSPDRPVVCIRHAALPISRFLRRKQVKKNLPSMVFAISAAC
jgi:hypothetical protein